MTINYANGIDDAEKFNQNLSIISITGNITLLAGITFLILSMVKKEERSYQYYVSIIGYPFFIMLTILTLF